MGLFLLFHAPGQTAELVQGVIDTTAHLVYVNAADQNRHLAPAPAGAIGNSRNHFKVPQQPGGCGFCLRLLFVDFPACLQEQRRFFQDPVPHLGRCVAPGCVQLSRFAGAQLMAGESPCHPFAVFDVGARHRNQKLHGCVRGYLSAANLLLDGIRKELHESKSA
jgi:hypothetical protein